MRTIVWFRQDLRVSDHPALACALKRGKVLPVYVLEKGKWAPAGAARKWLEESLASLAHDLPLEVLEGNPLEVIPRYIRKTKADALYCGRQYDAPTPLYSRLEKEGIEVQTFNTSLLVEPWEISTKEGKPCRVFTPFYKKVLKHGPFKPLSHTLKKGGEPFTPGEAGAHATLAAYSGEGSTHLSPYLHFGEISPRQVWHALKGKRRDLVWREFAYHLLYHFPETVDHPLRAEFERFPWENAPKAFKLWKEGKTGYPFVDAAMRQLKAEGWISNRARMVVASFLTKDLLIPWQKGAAWFWETLIDADLANNTLGWQWTSGCGADAAPYFRIFNPVTQGEKFDPDGTFVRRWVPEIAHLDNRWIHRPFEAPAEVAGYPRPVVDHRKARERALKAFERMKQ